MVYLATLKDKDIFPDRDFIPRTEWTLRKTVKVILKNDEGKIALVTNPKHNCFLLPGGAIDEGEEIFGAADRECREEANSSIKSPRQIGVIEEFRARDMKHYETYAVYAEVLERIDGDLRTDKERENQLSVVWFTKKDAESRFIEQEQRLRAGKMDFYNTAFNIIRDQIIFKEAYRMGLL
jgi:ADP-ribose pyrophosphatase YjhB (NUDIX family)